MKTFNDVDPTTNPFNEFLKNYGMWIAIGIAGLILVTVIILFVFTSKRKGTGVEFKKTSSFDNKVVIDALGGIENIIDHSIHGSRISISIKDINKVNESVLKENSVKSIIKMSKKITLLVEGDSNEFYNNVFKNSGL